MEGKPRHAGTKTTQSGGGRAMNDTSQQVVHWQRTKNLMIVHIVIWFIFSFVVHWIAPSLNQVSVPVMHFPLGY
jgi:uncharacterized membrane protein